VAQPIPDADRIAVWCRTGSAAHSDTAARAGDILNHHRLAERRRQVIGKYARNRVGHPTGRYRHNALLNASNASLYERLNFNFIHDIAPVAGIARGPQAMVHVPFRGNGPALTAMLGGQVEVQFPSVASSIEYIRTSKLRGLAVTSEMRSEALPDLPTVGEFVPGYEITAWFGVGAPKGTPANVIDKISGEITAILADPKMKARLADFADVPMSMTPTEFGKLRPRRPRNGPR
jgi:hypothetical protein